LAQTFSTAAWSSALTTVVAGERSAATATGRASSGSFLFVDPDASSRTRAPSLGWTSSVPGEQRRARLPPLEPATVGKRIVIIEANIDLQQTQG
jgi:hypothetical protein